jgi:hypothetical protein
MYLFVDFGLEFVGDVARRYGHPDLESLARKLLYFALVDQIGTILEGPGRALEGQQETACGVCWSSFECNSTLQCRTGSPSRTRCQ